MADMLVNLLKLPDYTTLIQQLNEEAIVIRRAMAPDKFLILDWVKIHSTLSAAGECDVCFAHTPISCFIATRGHEILGYACYHATAPNFFGPTRVHEAEQSKGIGKALLLRCLEAMHHEGYIYAIIGGIGPAKFYEKCVGALLIPESTPGIYQDFLGGMNKK